MIALQYLQPSSSPAILPCRKWKVEAITLESKHPDSSSHECCFTALEGTTKRTRHNRNAFFAEQGNLVTSSNVVLLCSREDGFGMAQGFNLIGECLLPNFKVLHEEIALLTLFFATVSRQCICFRVLTHQVCIRMQLQNKHTHTHTVNIYVCVRVFICSVC